jgi:hypothetical protein
MVDDFSQFGLKIDVYGFLGLASKPRSMVSPDLVSKPVAMVLMVWPQNHSLGFSDLGLKIGSCGLVIWPTKSPLWFFWFGLQNQGGGLPDYASKPMIG